MLLTGGLGLGEFIVIGIVLVIYFLPTIIGFSKKNAVAIFALNLLLGWSFLGWVIAFVWALKKD